MYINVVCSPIVGTYNPQCICDAYLLSLNHITTETDAGCASDAGATNVVVVGCAKRNPAWQTQSKDRSWAKAIARDRSRPNSIVFCLCIYLKGI